jgi:NitT/TauT family transport system permease protein
MIAAASFGSRPWDIFWKIVLPAMLPSIFTGMAVGMGITWEVVVAAEMIAGNSGLGYFTWASYVGGNYPQIIIGMISIGIAGYLSSGLIRILGNVVTPWKGRRPVLGCSSRRSNRPHLDSERFRSAPRTCGR